MDLQLKSFEAKSKKESVFVCTNEELKAALRRKSLYTGLADAILSGKAHQVIDFEGKTDLAEILANFNKGASESPDKKKVQF